MRLYFGVWALLTTLACAVVYGLCRIEDAPLPDHAASRYAYSALTAAISGKTAPALVPSARDYRAGTIIVTAYVAGERRARHIGHGSLAEVVGAAAAELGREPVLRDAPARVRFRVAVVRGSGPLFTLIPGLAYFSLVPLRDGVRALRGEQVVYLTPDDLVEHGATDRAVVGPVPDLTFGTDPDYVRELLGQALGQNEPLDGTWRVERVRIDALPEAPIAVSTPERAALLGAARDGVRFILRHQDPSGRFTYVYDAQ
ncbi:MAG: hypothetical protein ABW321_24820, partial [Polyangiales bacterium]